MRPNRTLRFFNTYEPVNGFYRELLPELVERGFEGEIVLSKAAYRSGGSLLEGNGNPREFSIKRVPAGFSRASSRLRKAVVIASYSIIAGGMALLSRPKVLNVFLTQPPLFSVVGLFVRRLKGQSYACVIMDLYPDVLVAARKMNPDSRIYRILKNLSVRSLSRAEVVIVIGRCMRDVLVTAGIEQERIAVINNWANADLIKPIPRDANPARRRLGLRNEFVVLYSGNMGEAHSFSTLLSAAENLSDRDDIRFVLMGQGVRRVEVEDEAHRRGLHNVILSDLVGREELASSQSIGDVHFVSLREAFTGLMVPSKAYSSLAAGRPLLYEGTVTGEIARVVRDHDLGFHIEPGAVDQLCTAIEMLADDPALRHEMGRRCREMAEGELGLATAAENYAAALGPLG